MSYNGINTRFAAYQDKINLELFDAILLMAATTSEDEDAMPKYRAIKRGLVWESRKNEDSNLLEKNGLRYIGEVLERYEVHFGAGKETMRAVALALGYAAPFLTDGMFIGNQKNDFLRKVIKESSDDLYLQAALCLLELDVEKYRSKLAELSKATFTKTEDAIFVLSLYDNSAQGFEVMFPQLVKLWGSERSISLIKNIGILEWLIVRYENVILKCKKRDNTILRTLMKFPYKFIKEGTTEFSTLSKAGYSREEIIYANSVVLWNGGIHKRLRYDGITAEKIAAKFCVTWLNHENEPDPEIIDYIGWLLSKYKVFQIKYQDNEGIWEAIRERVNPRHPKIVLWMVQNLEKGERFPYSFDVFDERWEMLAQELEFNQYQTVFSKQMLNMEKQTAENIQGMLNRFEELTGQNYLDTFSSYENYYSSECFALLVERKVINLWDFFQNGLLSPSNIKNDMPEFYYLRNYISGIRTREAFDFMNQVLSQYTVVELSGILRRDFRLHSGIYEEAHYGFHRDEAKLDFRRTFLTTEEERQLFEWIDGSVFRMQPKDYVSFVKTALSSEHVRELYDAEELKEILKELLKEGKIQNYEAKPLKEIYFTEEERQVEKMAAEAAEKEKKRQDKIQRLEKKRAALKEKFDGSFASILEYLKLYFWSNDQKEALSLIYDVLKDTVEKIPRPVSMSDMSCFLKICSKITKEEAMPWEKLYPLIITMVEGGKK